MMAFISNPVFFQFTTSQGGRPFSMSTLFFASIFQFTTSQGGRRAMWSITNPTMSFQFTTSQGGRRVSGSISWLQYLNFQFTTSQGGRLCDHISDRYAFLLSIHDLTRRSTRTPICCRRYSAPFNSRPHKEVDGAGHRSCSCLGSFNSRPHKEVDVVLLLPQTHQRGLSIHDLTRRSTLQRSGFLGCLLFQFTTSQGGRPFCHLVDK